MQSLTILYALIHWCMFNGVAESRHLTRNLVNTRSLATNALSVTTQLPATNQLVNTASYVFLATVTNTTSPIKFVNFQIQNPDGTTFTASASQQQGSNVWGSPVYLSPEGQYQWNVKVTDITGNALVTSLQPFFAARSAGGYIGAASTEIATLIKANLPLGPKFVRLGFHDCVGGCDGCVDMTNGDNNGLDIPINAVDPLVQKYANKALNISRADIWALAALTAANVTQAPTPLVGFNMSWIGRVNCEDAQSVCYNANNQVQPCSATRGPNRVLPGPYMTTNGILQYFSVNFDFNANETVAIMGAHSLGAAHRENSGFNGSWVPQNLKLQNSYYAAFAGPNGNLTTLQTKLTGWDLTFVNNSDQTSIPDRNEWEHVVSTTGNHAIMLHSDMALVRDLGGYLDQTTGAVTCRLSCATSSCSTTPPLCPYAAATIGSVAAYNNNNTAWLIDFQKAFSKMLIRGYDAPSQCSAPPCTLNAK